MVPILTPEEKCWFVFFFFIFAVKSLGEKGERREFSYIGKVATSLDN